MKKQHTTIIQPIDDDHNYMVIRLYYEKGDLLRGEQREYQLIFVNERRIRDYRECTITDPHNFSFPIKQTMRFSQRTMDKLSQWLKDNPNTLFALYSKPLLTDLLTFLRSVNL